MDKIEKIALLQYLNKNAFELNHLCIINGFPFNINLEMNEKKFIEMCENNKEWAEILSKAFIKEEFRNPLI